MKTIRLLIEGTDKSSVSQANIRGIHDVEVVSYNKRTAATVIRVDMCYWPNVFDWWKSSEVGGLRRTLSGYEVVR